MLISQVMVTSADWKEKFLARHPMWVSAKPVASLAPLSTSQKTLQPLDVSGLQELKACVSRAMTGDFHSEARQEAPSFH